MTDIPKLTRAQRELLQEIRNERQPVGDSYAPAKKLVVLGLAEFLYGKYGSLLQITAAGAIFLSESERANSKTEEPQ